MNRIEVCKPPQPMLRRSGGGRNYDNFQSAYAPPQIPNTREVIRSEYDPSSGTLRSSNYYSRPQTTTYRSRAGNSYREATYTTNYNYEVPANEPRNRPGNIFYRDQVQTQPTYYTYAPSYSSGGRHGNIFNPDPQTQNKSQNRPETNTLRSSNTTRQYRRTSYDAPVAYPTYQTQPNVLRSSGGRRTYNGYSTSAPRRCECSDCTARRNQPVYRSRAPNNEYSNPTWKSRFQNKIYENEKAPFDERRSSVIYYS